MVMPYDNDYFFDNEIDSDYEWLKKKTIINVSPQKKKKKPKKSFRKKKKN